MPCCGSYMANMAYRSHQHHQPRGQECAEAFHAFDDSRKDGVAGVAIIFVQAACDGNKHKHANRVNRARCQHGQHNIADQFFESIPLCVMLCNVTLGHVQQPFTQF